MFLVLLKKKKLIVEIIRLYICKGIETFYYFDNSKSIAIYLVVGNEK